MTSCGLCSESELENIGGVDDFDFNEAFGFKEVVLQSTEEWMDLAAKCISLPNRAAVALLIRMVVDDVKTELGYKPDRGSSPRRQEGGGVHAIKMEFKSSHSVVLLLEVLIVQPGKPRVEDLRNSAVIRDAVFKGQIRGRMRRGPDDRVQIPSLVMLKGCEVGTAMSSAQYRAVFTISELRGRSLRCVLEDHGKAFRDGGGILTESPRFLLRDMLWHLERWHSKGLFLDHVDFEELFYEDDEKGRGGRITVGYIGRGQVLDIDRAHCDQKSKHDQAVKMAGRMVTEAYSGADRKMVPDTVNKAHLRRVETAQAEAERRGAECEPLPALQNTVYGITTAQLNDVWMSLVRNPAGHLIDCDAEGAEEENWRRKDLRKFLLGFLPFFSREICDFETARASLETAVGISEAATIAFFMNPMQPLATGRLGKLAHAFLGSSNPAPKTVVSAPAVSTPNFAPEQERQLLSHQGLRMKVGRCVLEDNVWQGKMRASLKNYESETEPLEVDLVIEDDVLGVGVRVVGEWTKLPKRRKTKTTKKAKKAEKAEKRKQGKRFACWYVGKAVRGDVQFSGLRYIVSRTDDGVLRCDGEPCEMCPLEWYIKHGIPGPFINSNKGDPNLALDREAW